MTDTAPPENISSRLVERLANPVHVAPVVDAAAQWFFQDIVVRVKRPAAHAETLVLLNRIRGALGTALMRSASPAAKNGQPCPYDPPCTLDVFYRTQLETAPGFNLPRPFVLQCDLARRRIDVRLRVFGFATDWTMALRDALVASLAHDVVFLGRDEGVDVRGTKAGFEVEGSHIETVHGLTLADPPPRICLTIKTALDNAGTSLVDTPASFIARLNRRIEGLARWQDMALQADWGALRQAAEALTFDTDGLEQDTVHRGSRRQETAFENPSVFGDLVFTGPAVAVGAVWPFVVLGEITHAGRGATAGLGRYSLDEA
ncbi:MAG: CRISPR system precrRNA processing endoribonuclease RAMP protein Cas6 [Pseudomonadota bacterium]